MESLRVKYGKLHEQAEQRSLVVVAQRSEVWYCATDSQSICQSVRSQTQQVKELLAERGSIAAKEAELSMQMTALVAEGDLLAAQCEELLLSNHCMPELAKETRGLQEKGSRLAAELAKRAPASRPVRGRMMVAGLEKTLEETQKTTEEQVSLLRQAQDEVEEACGRIEGLQAKIDKVDRRAFRQTSRLEQCARNMRWLRRSYISAGL